MGFTGNGPISYVWDRFGAYLGYPMVVMRCQNCTTSFNSLYVQVLVPVGCVCHHREVTNLNVETRTHRYTGYLTFSNAMYNNPYT